MHSWGLYNGRYGLSDKVLIDTIPAADRHLADRMLEAELRRQDRLRAQLAEHPEAKDWIERGHLFQNYKQLQFFDTFALYFNRTHEGARGEAAFAHVPMNAKEDATIVIRPAGAASYVVSPYPFGEAPARFSFSGRYIEPARPDKPMNWGATLARTPREEQRFTLQPG
jgi:hypothetical protein